MTARNTNVLERLVKKYGSQVRTDVSMKPWTTFHCLSSARAMLFPRQLDELIQMYSDLRDLGVETRVIGRGSNLLVRDGGFPGALINLSIGFDFIDCIETRNTTKLLRVGAGTSNGKLLRYLKENQLSGFGFSFGIPGTIGGGIRMNAGTPLGWFSQITRSVEGIDAEGNLVTLKVQEDDFSYRDFPKGHKMILTSGVLEFKLSTSEEVACEIEKAKEKRANQPLDQPNIGSVFKNPEGDFAARLIELAGLKGTREGNAQISPMHANFIVNLGGAKTKDVLFLISMVQDRVKEQSHVNIEREVHVIGEDE